ncbi:MAG: M20 family peptidase [Chloroflexi bacterium]|jgi:glutamate carboxypeptidase|uniref:Peptidase M20 n=1 Tax=Candidatus Thermofonsia Clade 3 bacterium TaxID=2364212 RepID=A0A2M8QE40_9CHLR|nr:M20 family metallopeptidase [Candidatus Roseilinea sp. NK_OTU-006]PJF48069.1 MAG: peptidase M20 [Candidatus Thermofonsia Clade 3 bacterium]RMG63709.1 MAG: M20 family peptidase [Chloroflexota bacterium]
MHPLITYLNAQLPAMTELLTRIVSLESFSADKAGVDDVARLIAQELRSLNAEVTIFPQTTTGDHVLGVFNRGAGSPILMLLHMDTVHPRGSFAARYKIADGKMYGPGVFDMKASHVIALYAVQALQALGQMPRREIRTLFTSDEEIGSFTSEALIIEQARGAQLVMVMEPALADGRLKSSRRGVGNFTVVARGRASHAGGGHERGINAIQEMAHHILAIHALTDYQRGIATTVSEIQGGIAHNVVPDRCEIHVDARANTQADADWLTRQIYSLRPVLPGAQLEVSGKFERPPMECNAERLAIFERMKQIVAPILTLEHGPSGAGSDAAFTAPIAPTMDGLGAVGDGLHAADEHILLSSLVERAAMNALILQAW